MGQNARRVWEYIGRYGKASKGAKLLQTHTLLFSVPFGINSVIQLLYLKSLAYSPSSIGILLGIVATCNTVFTIPGSILADRLGRKNLLIVSTIAYAIYLSIFASSMNFYLLSFASLLNGISWGGYNSAFTALLAGSVREAHRSYVFSLNSFLFNIAIIVGNLVPSVGTFFHTSPIAMYRVLFLLGTTLSLFSIIPLLKLSEQQSVVHKNLNRLKLLPNTEGTWKVLKKFFVVYLLIGIGAGFFIPFLSLYMNLRYSVSETLIGAALAISNVVIAISFLGSPRVVEKMGIVKTITITQGLSLLPFFMLLLPVGFDLFVLFYSARAILMNMAYPIQTSYLMSTVEESERASVYGMVTTAWTGGSAISSVIAGSILSRSLLFPIILCGLFYFVATVLFYMFFTEPEGDTKQASQLH